MKLKLLLNNPVINNHKKYAYDKMNRLKKTPETRNTSGNVRITGP